MSDAFAVALNEELAKHKLIRRVFKATALTVVVLTLISGYFVVFTAFLNGAPSTPAPFVPGCLHPFGDLHDLSIGKVAVYPSVTADLNTHNIFLPENVSSVDLYLTVVNVGSCTQEGSIEAIPGLGVSPAYQTFNVSGTAWGSYKDPVVYGTFLLSLKFHSSYTCSVYKGYPPTVVALFWLVQRDSFDLSNPAYATYTFEQWTIYMPTCEVR